MDKNSTSLLDEHLKSLHGMHPAETNDFFYTRLRARMQTLQRYKGWSLPFKPVWVLSILLIFLAVNVFILFQQFRPAATSPTSNTIQGFADAYDQSISSFY